MQTVERGSDDARRPHDAVASIPLLPSWCGLAYWTMAAGFAGVVIAAMVARVPEYASGRAVVLESGFEIVTAPRGGTVADIVARPGTAVLPALAPTA